MTFRIWSSGVSALLVSSSLAVSATLFAGNQLLAQVAPAGAQTGVQTGASVQGSVLDPDAAAIPGATITLQPAGKAAAITTKSGVDGSFSLESVPAGTYTVTVTMAGFGSFVRPNVRVTGQAIKINVKLSIEEQSTTITVSTNENQVSVDPDSNGSSVVLKGSDLESLSDDPDELSNELSALAGPAAGPNGGQIFVDGFTGGQLPPKSAIREVRINQNPFSAQYDRPGFGRIEILTKPGTDKLHGNFSLQGMDKSFNTVTPFLQGGAQPDYHQIFFLGSVSGSLSKKVSFNLSGSQRTIQNNSVFAGTIASSGAGSTTLCAPGSGAACGAFALPPNARATFTPQERYDFSPRLDFALSDKNTLTARYQLEHNDQTNAGVGGLNLSTVGNNQNSRENTIQLSDTQIFSPKVINETRFEFERNQYKQLPVSTAPTLTVVGYFTGGGSSAGVQTFTSDHIEVQNYTSIQLQKNFIRAGFRTRTDRRAQFTDSNANGTFSYKSIADYLNNAPFQFAVTTYANQKVSGQTTDVGLYAEDDWKVKPNLTLTYGLRFEAQGGINSSHDLAPRLSVNYGIPHAGGNPVTVLRFGYGIFFDRFGVGDIIRTIQQNGTNATQQLFRGAANQTLPGCAPGSTAACGTGLTSANTIYSRAPNLRTAYNSQIAAGVDQQLPHHSTISATYINTIGVHQFFSRSLPTVGNNLQYQYQSEGYTRQNQLLLNGRAPISPKFSIFGFYALNFVNSNSSGPDNFQTSLNPRVDYGRPNWGNRSRLFLSGNWSAPFLFTVSPFMIANSGSPYNITTGTDVNGDSIINDRAEFATNGDGGSCQNPNNFTSPATITDNYARVSPGYCIGPANFTFNMRVVRAFGFGPKTGQAAGADQGGGGGPRGGRGGRGGGGGGFGGGNVSSGRKYTVSFGAQLLNLFNNVNYSPQNGNLSTVIRDANGNFLPGQSLFGHSQSLAGGPFSSGSAVRRVFLQANFSF
ncbi:carboxypeptidase regulatory-like domain-containing protein [Terriglobus sp.]|uniref:TonB-dependent receptor n=1 Tax=Terriglobus sp. TaxID=1889013 RepID=UPI003AFFF184